MVVRHNHLRDVIVDFCRRAHLSVTVEKGHGLIRDHNHTRPADVLIEGWDRGKPAAFDVTVTSPLCPAILRDSCRMSAAASTAAKTRKLLSNGPKCQELGWTCIPLAIEIFCNRGKEAHLTFSRLASHIAIKMSCHVTIGPPKNSPPGPNISEKNDPGGPIFSEKIGPPLKNLVPPFFPAEIKDPIFATKIVPPGTIWLRKVYSPCQKCTR